jgi:pSer/pThr/pTyr-binding forkhead associated (FHA) protein
MPKLTVSLPDSGDVVHDLVEELITVGRVDDNTIAIAHASVSSRHAQLSKDDADYVLRDLGSTNGTRVNGRELPEGEDFKLGDGDTVVFGNISVLYSSETPASSRPIPVGETVTSIPAAASARPADFANASPFESKKKSRDPAGAGLIALGVLALLAAGGAIALILQMQSPL